MPAMSLVGGRRLLPAAGNAQHGTTAVLRSLPLGNYRWSVQAVDSSFAGSSFTSEGSFTVSAAITGFTPACGPAGTTVTLTGTGFLGATGVAFHGTGATFTVASATSISTRVPPGATSGPISVTTPSGTATSADSFAIACPAPTVTSFSPTSGGVGAAVAITGTHFPGATQVQFNGSSAAAYAVDSATRITATVPIGATTGAIKVTTPSGTATSALPFTVIPAPSIGSFYPASGPVGTSVRISGSGFEFATRVQVGGTSGSPTRSTPTTR